MVTSQTLIRMGRRCKLLLLILFLSIIDIISFLSLSKIPSHEPNLALGRNKQQLFVSLSSILDYHDDTFAVAKEKSNGLQEMLNDLLINGQKKSHKMHHHKGMVNDIKTPEDLKEFITNEKENIIIVRFHAHWCQSCLQTTPYYHKLAKKEDSVTFINVQITKQNTKVFKSLGVPSVPCGHLYFPNIGLIEQFKMGKDAYKNKKIQKKLSWLKDGYCELDTDNEYFGCSLFEDDLCLLVDDGDDFDGTKL